MRYSDYVVSMATIDRARFVVPVLLHDHRLKRPDCILIMTYDAVVRSSAVEQVNTVVVGVVDIGIDVKKLVSVPKIR